MIAYDAVLHALVLDASDTPERSPERLAAVKRILDFHQREWPLLKLAEALEDAEHVAVDQDTDVVLEEFRDVSARVAGDTEAALLLLRATSPLLDRTLPIEEAGRRALAVLDDANHLAAVTPLHDRSQRERLAA